jgi:hypothetical protein
MAVIVFCPDGTIPICCFNVPGSVHDSLMAEWGSVYDKLGRVYARCGGGCTVDSAFSRKNHPYLIKSSQTEFGEENHQRICGEFTVERRSNIDTTICRMGHASFASVLSAC